MIQPTHTGGGRACCRREAERGGSRLNLLIVLAIMALVAYSAYQYAPVAYKASLLKVYMQDTVNNAVAANRSTEWVRLQLQSGADEYGLPPDASIEVQHHDSRMEAHIRFSREVELPGYVYHYNFDHTARSNAIIASGGGG